MAHLDTSLFPFSPTAGHWSLRTVEKSRIVPFCCPACIRHIRNRLQRRCGTFTWHLQPTGHYVHGAKLRTPNPLPPCPSTGWWRPAGCVPMPSRREGTGDGAFRGTVIPASAVCMFASWNTQGLKSQLQNRHWHAFTGMYNPQSSVSCP